MILGIIKNIVFIVAGIYLINTERNNFIAQAFWGTVGIIIVVGNVLELVGRFN